MTGAADMERGRAIGLADARERARAAWEEVWRAEAAPPERFVLRFESGWAGCGEVMSAVCGFAVGDVAWAHDPPSHTVEFTCTFETLKSIQLACAGTSVPKGRMHFQRVIPRGGVSEWQGFS